MCSKKMFSMMMAAVMTVGVSAGTVSAETDYEPVTITLNLQRSGLGECRVYIYRKAICGSSIRGTNGASFL